MNYEQSTFIANSCDKLFEINKDSAYVVSIGFVREMDIHLKKCIKERVRSRLLKSYSHNIFNRKEIKPIAHIIGSFFKA